MAEIIAPEFVDGDDAQDALDLAERLTRLLSRPRTPVVVVGEAPAEAEEAGLSAVR